MVGTAHARTRFQSAKWRQIVGRPSTTRKHCRWSQPSFTTRTSTWPLCISGSIRTKSSSSSSASSTSSSCCCCPPPVAADPCDGCGCGCCCSGWWPSSSRTGLGLRMGMGMVGAAMRASVSPSVLLLLSSRSTSSDDDARDDEAEAAATGGAVAVAGVDGSSRGGSAPRSW